MRGKYLTPAQAKYLEFRLGGEKPSQAYAKAYPNASAATRACKPYELEKQPLIKQALAAALAGKTKEVEQIAREGAPGLVAAGVLSKEQAEAGATRAEKRRVLKRAILNSKLPMRERIMAIQTDNLMTGDNKPMRFEGDVTLRGVFMALTKSTGLPDPNELQVFELGHENGANGNGVVPP